jgi:hypothetical protein
MAQTELTESGGRLPQPTEEVHLPEPSYLPVIVAFGVTVFLVGIIVLTAIAVIGAIITLVALVKWIAGARREMRELPLEH